MSDAAMPAPDLERRDSLGRLISLTWKGECSCANTSGERWLVAVDGSACSSRAVAVGARLVAMGQGSMLELVNVCWRRFKIEPPCRLNFEPGLLANR